MAFINRKMETLHYILTAPPSELPEIIAVAILNASNYSADMTELLCEVRDILRQRNLGAADDLLIALENWS